MDAEAARSAPSRIGFVKGEKQKVVLRNRRKKGAGQKGDVEVDAWKQTWKLFRKQIRGMLLTGIFLAVTIIALYIYQAHGNVTRNQRLVFNTITTGLGLGLGLNFFEVFKDMAKVLRWRILSAGQFSAREVDLVMGSESLMKAVELFFESWKRPLIMLACFFWLLLNIAAQGSIAILPLFYSLENGKDSSGIVYDSGQVQVPKLDCYRMVNDKECPKDNHVVPTIAHLCGEMGAAPDGRCDYTTDDDINNAPQNCSYFKSTTKSEFALRLADYNEDDFNNKLYPYLQTWRFIKIAAEGCNGWTPDPPGQSDSEGDGIQDEWVWTYSDGAGHNETLTMPKVDAASQATTYIWNAVRRPGDANNQTCGDRCVYMYALRNMDHAKGGSIFQCRINVSEVVNATTPAQALPDSVARTAAASIAQTGRWRTLQKEPYVEDWRQWQLYQFGSYWALGADDTPDEIGARMAEFAATSLKVMIQRNPAADAYGVKPELGYQIDIHWKWIIVIAAGIAAAHVLGVGLMLLLARPVAVGDDSFLVAAHLLRSLVEGLPEGYEPRLWDEKGIAEEITAEIGRRDEAPKGEEMKGLLREPMRRHSSDDS